ncbi:phage tail protein [Aeromonas veronii]|uniref:phage tail protein n=1 Tax=Aeromonas veronii TaxID=654 RepID=UPI0013E0C1A3|nr:phage tail protein [Aeromonas veronii]QIF43966.1 phage tail protein [Aeromonas veronii]
MSNFGAILTNAGAAKLANAIALGVPLKLTQMAVGDGNGQPVTPDPAMTAIPGEKRRAAINTLFPDPLAASQLVAEQIIPEDVGGWWIRCVGLYDDSNTLIAIANVPDTYKPLLASGAGRTQIIRMVLIVSDTSAVELKIDPSVVLATRKYVDEVMKAHKESRDHPYATTKEKGLSRLATDEEARLGQSIEAVMTSKNVSDAVKEMLKQLFVGVPIPWMLPEPPAWGISLSGQAINPVTDPLLAARYPSGRLPDARADVIRGWDNGRGIDPGRALLSHQGDAGRRITGTVAIGYNYRETYSDMTGAFTVENESTSTSKNSGPAGITAPVLLKFDSALALPNNTAGEFRGSNLAYLMITMRG